MNNFTRVLLAVLLAAVCLPAWAGVLSQVTQINDPYLTALDEFGSSGARISDNGLSFLVAAPGVVLPPAFNDGTGVGILYNYTGGAWDIGPMLQNVSGPPTAVGFGTGLALSADGSTYFLGFASGCQDPMDCGAPVYAIISSNHLGGLFDQILDPNGDASSEFGSTGAISGDGQTVLIGAPNAVVAGLDGVGDAYFYTYSAGTWVQTLIADPDGAQDDFFGYGVALSADGTTALIGSLAGGGKMFLYELVGGFWIQYQEFDNLFICQGCLALDANGQTAISTTDTGVRIFTQDASPAVWSSVDIPVVNGFVPVAMSADGTAMVIGSTDQAFLYTLNAGTWDVGPTFSDPAADPASGFGQTGVALSADKETMVITAGFAKVGGQSEAGTIFVYQSPADLSLAMTANPTLVALNQQVTLNATVTNPDPAVTAYNVSFAYAIPAGLSFFSAVPAGGTCSLGGPGGLTVTCTLPSLAPGATWQPSVTIKVTTAGAYTNTASVTSNQPDPNTANNTATVSISMLPPTVSNGSVTTTVNTPVNGTLTGSNPCACGILAFATASLPAHGTVTITDATTGVFKYTPTAGFIGSDSFTFTLSNGLNTSGPATESITVNDVAPTANNGSVSTTVNNPVSGTLSVTPGYAGQTLTYSVVASPAHGSVTVTASSGAFTYTPAAGFSGSDNFTFKAGDGTVTSNIATETVTVNPGGGGGSVDFLALGLLGGLLAVIQRRRRKH